MNQNRTALFHLTSPNEELPASSAFPSHWHVLYTMPRHEEKVAAHLARNQIPHFLPKLIQKRIWSDRIKRVELPLFPGYIFTAPADRCSYLKSLEHPGAKLYLQERGRPALIHGNEIQNIQRLVEYHQDSLEASPLKLFQVGQRVRVIEGALKGVVGIVERLKSARKLYVLLPLLNQMISTRIDPRYVEPLEEAF